MGYYFYHPSDHKVFVLRGGTFLEREFLAEGIHCNEMMLDEDQQTNETFNAQKHDMELEQPFLDVLIPTQRLLPSNVAVQYPVAVQEHVTEPFQEQMEQPMNPKQGDSDPQVPLRRSTRSNHAPDRLNLMVLDAIANEDYHSDDDPKCYEEAMQSLDHEKCQEAMESEMESMKPNKVWTLVEASKDIKPIGCKWVYKKTIGAYGKVETYKKTIKKLFG
ncbi:PREDICTED: uncharacterized protein LOC109359750 [Lupinus angustifolius]|uniref:uncharacterized protein LOC109359750 n=1 Tax=Lupinus angustifolius TaxID=3871 RepID=UPI00092F713A|nr:PREDICTED: uncharacterized protein LOC109359750 [Lupinus angustifolius]